nr:MAG TPA: hypothetical protein [Crassvirales sp.]
MIVVIEIFGIFWLLMAFAYLFKAQGIKEANKFVVNNYKPNNVYKKFLETTVDKYKAYMKESKYYACYAVAIFAILITVILCSK